MTGPLDTEKRALRAELRERRQQRSAASLEEAAAGIRAQLDALVTEHGVRSMSCFLSTPTEPGTREFIAAAVARGIRVLLPVTRADGLLDWAVAEEEGDTAEGMFGLPEPVGELLSPVAVNDVDLLVIPAAAVDTTGMRLGWGRGYFDKTIGSMEKCPPVYAVIFDSELIDSVPREVHDQPVSGVVTPTRTVLLPTR
ncbi:MULTISPECIES: 5-formyltetrahydrofolate cyclo-ligase [Microbacterium]|uniref:5-formyltetrahydrofolate cyclo-ligase n=1 Tax=Microbacterium aquilitoris TaxID=3067307 RepID=A0ABU3GJF2_9MICO|nr:MULTISPECIES: 5-formyltetrahydrofolate cyclo-ligase [unclassified Microbacterium]MDT3330817.1 5-formyltetrahydrofolate cyclo-ligase [Microbacterium sp. KSW-18]MDT3344421.1 5-formyltetrahydrofolate cyclo-ligase [Microbacterium sp. KSW2-22]